MRSRTVGAVAGAVAGAVVEDAEGSTALPRVVAVVGEAFTAIDGAVDAVGVIPGVVTFIVVQAARNKTNSANSVWIFIRHPRHNYCI